MFRLSKLPLKSFFTLPVAKFFASAHVAGSIVVDAVHNIVDIAPAMQDGISNFRGVVAEGFATDITSTSVDLVSDSVTSGVPKVLETLTAALEVDEIDWGAVLSMLTPPVVAKLSTENHYKILSKAVVKPVGALALVHQLVLDKKLNVNATDRSGYTVLHKASETTKEEVVRFLLAHGASPDTESYIGDTPYVAAARQAIYGDEGEKASAREILNLCFAVRIPPLEVCKHVYDWVAPYLSEEEGIKLMGEENWHSCSHADECLS